MISAPLSLMASALGGFAFELPPEAYARARAEADTVMVIDIVSVAGLPFWRSHGTCRVVGGVESVERGRGAGQGPALGRLTVDVPCVQPSYNPPPAPFAGYPQGPLRRAERAKVYLKNGALVLRGLDVLE